ncbi:hypothetical protein EVAR_50394_1 [Eumeta japonica]|uniref:Uncharacterized protein n=1 Tax=Eumeta variegata TaxID=151549 RepID=A0A4C1WVP0_EUMVA|nr:hypothetical protein EVAR_50394_1 [Eumeta japonica]
MNLSQKKTPRAGLRRGALAQRKIRSKLLTSKSDLFKADYEEIFEARTQKRWSVRAEAAALAINAKQEETKRQNMRPTARVIKAARGGARALCRAGRFKWTKSQSE